MKTHNRAVERCLIIDDNREVADSLAELLMQGHEARVAYDGKSALSACESFSPTLALADLEMPDMEGYALAHRLRTCLGQHQMLVALTAGDESRRRSAAAGFDYHLTKPVEIESINALIASNRRGHRR